MPAITETRQSGGKDSKAGMLVKSMFSNFFFNFPQYQLAMIPQCICVKKNGDDPYFVCYFSR